jgi:Ni,Fe-hydrogenase III small subunit
MYIGAFLISNCEKLDFFRQRHILCQQIAKLMWKLLSKIITTGNPTESAKTSSTPSDPAFEAVGNRLKDVIHSLYGGRSLRIRHVDAGSSNAEEFELTATGNAFYDIERFGIGFVASPRHADIITVSGPVTRNMEHALKTAYDMTPEPRLVIAVGDGACTGGIWRGSYAMAAGTGAAEDVIPVDVKIPGDPPTPMQFIEGLLAAISSVKK